jgi:hypothetical protein
MECKKEFTSWLLSSYVATPNSAFGKSWPHRSNPAVQSAFFHLTPTSPTIVTESVQ